jgi:PII-like signaling protein
VNEDCLKLTIYGGERARADGGFAADALLDLYGRHEVQASLLLRGHSGFGIEHHLRTDRLLTLSEDLPVVSVAVDARQRIEALLDDVLAIQNRGLVTLERARMLSGEIGATTVSDPPGEATKLTVYLGRQERVAGAPAHVAVCDLLHRRGIAGATVLLGVDGTAHGVRQRARFFARNAGVPVIVIAVGDGPRIASVLTELGGLLQRPLLTLEPVRVCKRDGRRLSAPPVLPEADPDGLRVWQKLMVFSSEQAKVGGVPQHEALIRRLRASGARGATTLRGVWGFHGDHPPHGDRLLQLRRHVPVVTVIVDRPEGIAHSFEVVDELTQERGLVTSEIVPALTALTGNGHFGALRPARPDRDLPGA